MLFLAFLYYCCHSNREEKPLQILKISNALEGISHSLSLSNIIATQQTTKVSQIFCLLTREYWPCKFQMKSFIPSHILDICCQAPSTLFLRPVPTFRIPRYLSLVQLGFEPLIIMQAPEYLTSHLVPNKVTAARNMPHFFVTPHFYSEIPHAVHLG